MTNSLNVFIDCEFTDFINCDLISIGACTEAGDSFYGENTEFRKNWCSSWVVSNILPILRHGVFDMRRTELSARLWTWIDDLPAEEVIICYDYSGDYDLLLDLLEDPHPKIAGHKHLGNSMIKSCNQISEVFGGQGFEGLSQQVQKDFDKFIKEFLKERNLSKHVAIDDALANCFAYNKVCNKHGLTK